MKFVFLMAFVIIFALILKPQCSREQVNIGCKEACNDRGYDFKESLPAGTFTYRCLCKDWPRDTGRIYPRR